MCFQEGAFRDSRIRELYFSDCDLMQVSSAEFAGLESSLELLDLSGNNITTLPSPIFQEYDFLRTLNFRENKLQTFSPGNTKNPITPTLTFPRITFLRRFYLHTYHAPHSAKQSSACYY